MALFVLVVATTIPNDVKNVSETATKASITHADGRCHPRRLWLTISSSSCSLQQHSQEQLSGAYQELGARANVPVKFCECFVSSDVFRMCERGRGWGCEDTSGVPGQSPVRWSGEEVSSSLETGDFC